MKLSPDETFLVFVLRGLEGTEKQRNTLKRILNSRKQKYRQQAKKAEFILRNIGTGTTINF